MKQKKSLKFNVFMGLAVLVVLLVAGFFMYVGSYYKASSVAKDRLTSDAVVTVVENEDILFEPVSNAKNVGFVFYPGAKVEASAYAAMAKEIAANGYPVVIAKMTFNLAILSPNRADQIISEHPDIDTWVIGGHSLGGVMAADYALHNDEIRGLVLLASYPQAKTNLSGAPIKVLSLWGSHDEVADLQKVKGAEKVTPSDATFTEIQGGNHGGFGEYGHQKGDGKPSITHKEQIKVTTTAILELLDGLHAASETEQPL